MHLPHLSSALVVALALSLSACSSTPSEAEPAATPYTISSEQLTLEGTITRIDKADRVVVIRGSEGNEIEFQADADMRNFDQLEVGDKVSLDYTSAVAVDIQPAGSAEVGTTIQEGASMAAAGARPGASTNQTVTIVAEVMGVDTAANTVTVKGPRGNVVTLDVARDDLRQRLTTLKVGDKLRATFTEAIAVNVRPSP
ncbi:hypothetical protein IP90_02393 [Luteimonas cucumeris]|uniref:DUF5666 domain-containing protein n=1 Tax=Luteimonas cucumeris TaxID=985012 RepID=A0A562L2H4_9GAMM|nr:hypothetical protein [Luteimonas cucumeris]TWI01833.1 hypothetical protein IP90_02393 [Luteimonas cucumeris]